MSLTKYLLRYLNFQDDILLVSRPTLKDSWQRAIFLGEGYDSKTVYNHRSILHNEIVFEYDYEEKDLNEYCVNLIIQQLKKDKIEYAKWNSGNKSTHLHILIDTKNANNLNILKQTVLRHYGTFFLKNKRVYLSNKGLTEYKRLLPDMRLASNGLIRAEYGNHEKTGRHKHLQHKTKNYFSQSQLPPAVWDSYLYNVKKHIERKLSYGTGALFDTPQIKYILSTDFRDAEDGRERALFILIHVLKPLYVERKKELIKYLQDWYRYSGGTKVSGWAIDRKVHYHWKKDYTITQSYIDNFLYELGVDDRFKKDSQPTK